MKTKLMGLLLVTLFASLLAEEVLKITLSGSMVEEKLQTITFTETDMIIGDKSYPIDDIQKIAFGESSDMGIIQIPNTQKSEDFIFAPNPVSINNGEIFFTVPSNIRGKWKVTMYDAMGNTIDLQEFENNSTGHLYKWDLRNKAGVLVSSGTYVAIITVENSDGTTKKHKRIIGVKN